MSTSLGLSDPEIHERQFSRQPRLDLLEKIGPLRSYLPFFSELSGSRDFSAPLRLSNWGHITKLNHRKNFPLNFTLPQKTLIGFTG